MGGAEGLGGRERVRLAIRAQLVAGERLQQPVRGHDRRLGDVVRQGVADRVLRPERRPHPLRGRADVAELAVAEAVRERLEEPDPSVEPALARRASIASTVRADASAASSIAGSSWRAGPGSRRIRARGRQASGAVITRGSRFRSEPLTRIRNE